ncbi:MAG: hypothetical protein IPL79_16205 [Myxococcales bacterium]|nr:hypothetical protein [Myxococcales bacterium]
MLSTTALGCLDPSGSGDGTEDQDKRAWSATNSPQALFGADSIVTAVADLAQAGSHVTPLWILPKYAPNTPMPLPLADMDPASYAPGTPSAWEAENFAGTTPPPRDYSRQDPRGEQRIEIYNEKHLAWAVGTQLLPMPLHPVYDAINDKTYSPRSLFFSALRATEATSTAIKGDNRYGGRFPGAVNAGVFHIALANSFVHARGPLVVGMPHETNYDLVMTYPVLSFASTMAETTGSAANACLQGSDSAGAPGYGTNSNADAVYLVTTAVRYMQLNGQIIDATYRYVLEAKNGKFIGGEYCAANDAIMPLSLVRGQALGMKPEEYSGDDHVADWSRFISGLVEVP